MRKRNHRVEIYFTKTELEKALESNRASDKLIAETYTMEPD